MNKLEKHVLEIIGENTSSPDVFLDTDAGLEPIRDSLNDAIQEICAITGSYEQTYYIPLIADQGFYKLKYTSGHFGWVVNAWLSNHKRRLRQTDLIRLHHENPRWLEDTGTPESYFQIGTNILGFYRRPSGGDDVVELSSVVIPPRYASSTDRLYLRKSFQWAAVHYAVSEYWISRGEAREARKAFDRYLTLLGLQNIYPKAGERQWGSSTVKTPVEQVNYR